jgi:hypothetical protein
MWSEKEKTMLKSNNNMFRKASRVAIGLVMLVLVFGCAPEEPAPTEAEPTFELKIPLAGQENSGFLGDYTGLEPDPFFEGEALTYVNEAERERLRDYVAIIVDPVQVYIATDSDAALIPTGGPEAAASYFRYALINAVSDAFPLMKEAGPLVLRLRTALVGIDVAEGPLEGVDEAHNPLPRAIDIGEVMVEMELVDSETGERIAAMIDKAPLGAEAQIGAVHFSRSERFDAAQEAFDEWALRLRMFLDDRHELRGEGAERADREYTPY